MADNSPAWLPGRLPGSGRWKLTPGRIAAVYVALGVGALYVSDALLPSVVPTQPLLGRLQLAKGLLEVTVTGGLIYVLTSWYRDALDERTEHLDAATTELSVLHRVFRHNLRNDVTVVAGHADTLEDAVDQPRLEDHCDAIQRSCENLLGYTEKVKLLAELEYDTVQTTRVDLASVFATVASRFEAGAQDAELSVSVPENAVVNAHGSIEFAFAELVENALIHNDADRPSVAVTVREAPECPGWLQVCVEDNGPGIPEAEREGIRREDEPLRHSDGVGLWVARWIVVRSGGDLEIENTDHGCRVTVTLPTPTTTPGHQAEAALQRFLE